ncbi:LexA family protein [Anaerofustis stercorihominis]|uniref:DNA-binding helix-turn-helix protein n=2 Tax=Anaerofustis stercorihominis TaxID=214853 RepID=B1C5X0_9FIRM|nr:S24 family peptidase [Anaerofustis stercorihominis]EDS73539.1 DNA-binding helix-turn-helix protein [Anaerofustis stercorihominis DSM 17244]MCQ4794655.1 helix-turn-helix domain-containing protein [Anaerofustis stercorihominis]RGD73744.1 helix-turn-helix domain-containing protein [Anaerofustis stercorihominis]
MFGEKLRSLRKEHGMTQVDLANALDLDKSSIAKYESAGIIPSVDTLQKISALFNVSIDYLLNAPFGDINNVMNVEIIGTVVAGRDGIATYEFLGISQAININNKDEYKYLKVRGDSMAPQILEGDLALVRLQPDIDSGDLAVVIIGGEEGVIKKVQKTDNSISLISFNPMYDTRVFIGKDMEQLQIFGKVVKVERSY